MQRTLIIIGVAVLIAGLLWPWLSKLGLGRLPGDILIERPGVRLHFPLMTALIISAIISLLIWLFRR